MWSTFVFVICLLQSVGLCFMERPPTSVQLARFTLGRCFVFLFVRVLCGPPLFLSPNTSSMSRKPSTKTQLHNLRKLVDGFPTSQEDHAAWARAKSRSSFRPDSPFPPLPAVPISAAAATARIFWRDFDWNREAPARLLPGLLRILEQASGRLRRSCLYAIQYFRIKHFRSYKPGSPKVPPFSDLERKLLAPAFVASLVRRPELFSVGPPPLALPAFEVLKVVNKLKEVYPQGFNRVDSKQESKEEDLNLIKQVLPLIKNSVLPAARTTVSSPDFTSEECPDINTTSINEASILDTTSVRYFKSTTTVSDSSDSGSSLDVSRDEFAFVEKLPRPSATDDRHLAGKRKSTRTSRFASSDYIF